MEPLDSAPKIGPKNINADINNDLGGEFLMDEEPQEMTPAERNEEVVLRHENGESNVDIAKSLHMGVGEVNLVIDLYNRRKNK